MPMKTVLFFPRFRYQNFFSEPLSVYYLASVLRKGGFDFDVIDGTTETFESAVREMEVQNPDVLAISVQTVFAGFAKAVAGRFKESNPKGIVIAGGPHPTIMPGDVLKTFADFVVMGEGEATLPELLKNIRNPARVKGIAYMKGGKVVKTPPREPVKNLDDIPFPARDLMGEKYFQFGNAMLIGSRGCPYNCSFCQPTQRKLFGNAFRQRSPGNVVSEIKYAKRVFKKKGYEMKTFSLTDDGITYNKKWLEGFCRLLISEKINLPWEGDTRADTIPGPELLRLMKKSGCYRLSIGVESGNDYIRNTILRKQLKREKIIEAFRTCHESGIEPHSFIMVGSPGESMKSVMDTVLLLDEIKPTTTQVTITTPLPGTDLYSHCEENNIIRADAWSDYDYYVESHLKLENFTNEQIKKMRARLKFSIIGRTFARRYLKTEMKYSTVFRLLSLPFLTDFLMELEWGSLSQVRRKLQGVLGLNFTAV